MSRVLAGSIGAVVTANTVSSDVDMIKICGQPASGAVAVVTSVAAGNVCQVFACRDDTVMAGSTSADDLGVIDSHHGGENIGGVAVLANIRRLDVRQVLANCIGAVVAADTVSGDVDVVEVGGQPADRAVAVVAGIAARYMCQILAGGDHAVMAGTASADDLGVINGRHGNKRNRCMTIFTDVRGLDMCLALASCSRAVMTRTAGTQNLCVIDGNSGSEYGRAVAVFADICCLNVGLVLAGCLDTIMATDTVACDIGVVEIGR